jgi:glycosyltransferase involved in cell wall biosynthesis
MSVFNNRKYLGKAITSVLGQSYSNFEFVIVNDASTDDSIRILRRFAVKDKRIKLIDNKNRIGLTKSLIKALRYVKGKYVARMDADDISLPCRFAEQIKFMDKHPEVGLSGSWAILIDQKGKKLKLKKMPTKNKDIVKEVIKANPFIHSTLIFRRSVFKEIGFYNKDFIYAQDYELILRLLKKYKGANIPEPLILYRVDDKESISVKKIKEQEKFAIKARLKSLKEYGYPWWQLIFLLKPIFSYLVPANIKLFLYKKFYWNN